MRSQNEVIQVQCVEIKLKINKNKKVKDQNYNIKEKRRTGDRARGTNSGRVDLSNCCTTKKKIINPPRYPSSSSSSSSSSSWAAVAKGSSHQWLIPREFPLCESCENVRRTKHLTVFFRAPTNAAFRRNFPPKNINEKIYQKCSLVIGKSEVETDVLLVYLYNNWHFVASCKLSITLLADLEANIL